MALLLRGKWAPGAKKIKNSRDDRHNNFFQVFP